MRDSFDFILVGFCFMDLLEGKWIVWMFFDNIYNVKLSGRVQERRGDLLRSVYGYFSTRRAQIRLESDEAPLRQYRQAQEGQRDKGIKIIIASAYNKTNRRALRPIIM